LCCFYLLLLLLSVFATQLQVPYGFSSKSFPYFVKSSTFIFLKHCYLLISSPKILLYLIHLSRFVHVGIGECSLL
ncbi:predicted protein, partial [Arabidopsis lyrata subsp. lyrata]